MTSQSILGRRDFPDYEMLDVVMASALKKLLARSLPKKSKRRRALTSSHHAVDQRS